MHLGYWGERSGATRHACASLRMTPRYGTIHEDNPRVVRHAGRIALIVRDKSALPGQPGKRK